MKKCKWAADKLGVGIVAGGGVDGVLMEARSNATNVESGEEIVSLRRSDRVF